MRFFIVEDDKQLASFVDRGLREHGFAVDAVLEQQRKPEGYEMILCDMLDRLGQLCTRLGLSICKKIGERHGGKISAASRRGEGTAITVEIPVA